MITEVQRVYIAGPITGIADYKERFAAMEKMLTEYGLIVLNPAVLPAGLTAEEYMSICLPMLQCCDAIVLLDGWTKSRGACIEHGFAMYAGKTIIKEGDVFIRASK